MTSQTVWMTVHTSASNAVVTVKRYFFIFDSPSGLGETSLNALKTCEMDGFRLLKILFNFNHPYVRLINNVYLF